MSVILFLFYIFLYDDHDYILSPTHVLVVTLYTADRRYLAIGYSAFLKIG